MYTTYTLECKTNNLDFLQIYDTRQEAIDHLKRDATYHFEQCYQNAFPIDSNPPKIEHVSESMSGEGQSHNRSLSTWLPEGVTDPITTIQEKEDGLYLTYSHNYANRILGYARQTVITPGLFYFNTSHRVDIHLLRIYSLIEIPPGPLDWNRPKPLLSQLLHSRLKPITGNTPESQETNDGTRRITDKSSDNAAKVGYGKTGQGHIDFITQSPDATDAIISELKAHLKNRRASIKPRCIPTKPKME